MKRLALILPLIALAACLLVFLGWCFLKDPLSFPYFLWFLCLLSAVPAAPFVLIGFWARRRRRAGKRGAAVLRAVAFAGIPVVILLVGWCFYCTAPLFDAVIARGETPDGREFAVSQGWIDWFDGYDLQLFIREEAGEWRSIWGGRDWHPHSPFDIRFDDPDGLPYLAISDGYDRRFGRTGNHYQDETLPAAFSVDELHARHLRKLSDNRKPFRFRSEGAHAESAEAAEP